MSVTINGTTGITSPNLTDTSLTPGSTVGVGAGGLLNSSGGSGSGTVSAGTAGQLATYAASGTTVSGLSITQGSVLFAGASNAVAQDNANLFWDDTNNRLGIGTSSPTDPIDIRATSVSMSLFSTTSGNSALFSMGNSTDAIGCLLYSSGYEFRLSQSSANAASKITFYTQNAYAMGIDGSGNLLVGSTTSGTGTPSGFSLNVAGGGSFITVGHSSGVGSGQPYAVFGYNGTPIGSIAQSGTSGVLYNTSSDYRLKENVQPISNASAKIKFLNPVTYNWKSDGSDGEGFIAHELQVIIPHAVSGEKDAIDEDGNIKPQGVDYSRLTPMLTAALKEALEKIDALEARLAALESK
jgi:hypothetical protein